MDGEVHIYSIEEVHSYPLKHRPLDRFLLTYSITIYLVPQFPTKSSLVTYFPSFISIFLSFLLNFFSLSLVYRKIMRHVSTADSYTIISPIIYLLFL